MPGGFMTLMTETDMEGLRRLVAQPTEGLNLELKNWIDPGTTHGAAKIVKGLVALRNRNGGHLVVGFNDKTFHPDPSPSWEVRRAFNVDDIQMLVSRHVSEPFEVAVQFVSREGVDYPVVIVPTGVRVPVAIKRGLTEGNKILLVVGEVPFRTLLANGTYSSASVQPNDWQDIMDICFENREADIGRFIRRQLSGVNIATIDSLISALAAGNRSDPGATGRAKALLERGWIRYQQLKAERGVAAGAEAIADKWGTWEVAAVVDPPLDGKAPTRKLYDQLVGSNPKYTQWPSWPDTRMFSDDYAHPKPRAGGWESLVVSVGSSLPWDFLLFSRLEPEGRFYQLRVLDDDALARARQARTNIVLDPGLMASQVAEAIAVALHFARTLGCVAQSTKLAFAFRWRGLMNRVLVPWSSNVGIFLSKSTPADDEDLGFVVVPLDVSDSALAPYVESATAGLFAKFDGYALPANVIENRVKLLLERKT
jgi:hypothetical protein